jgi:hypothetical protein
MKKLALTTLSIPISLIRDTDIGYLWDALMTDFSAIIGCIPTYTTKASQETEVSTPIEQERQSQGKEKLDDQLYLRFGKSFGESDLSLKHLFYESCLTLDSSPSIEKHEILCEIAAIQGICVDKVKNKFPVLRQKLQEIVKVSKAIEKQKRIFRSSSSLRKTKRAIKRFLSFATRRMEIIIEITDNLWDYLPISGKEWIESLAYSLISLRADDVIEKIQRNSESFRKATKFYKFLLCFSSAISRFLRSVSHKAAGRDLSEQVLRDQNIDETEYLFHSKKNAERLNAAIERSKLGVTKPMTLDELYRELGASEEEEKRPEDAINESGYEN